MQSNAWTTIWSHAQRGCGLINQNSQLSQIIKITNVCADTIRFRFSSFYEQQNVRIHHAYVKHQAHCYALCFDGKQSITLKPAQSVVCDDMMISMKALDTLYLSYQIEADMPCASGVDLTRDLNVSCHDGIAYLFQGIEVWSNQIKGCICAFGDSIVEMAYWTTPLAKLLKQEGYALVNQGISGNRLLKELQRIHLEETHAHLLDQITKKQDKPGELVFDHIPLASQCFGIAGMQRFKQELLTTHVNLDMILVGIGVNDLYQPGSFCAAASELPSLEEMILGYQKLIDQAAEKQIPIVFCGLTSFLGSNQGSKEKEMLRWKVNAWLAHQGCFIGFDDLLCEDSMVLRDEMHGGDHLHPNEKGGMCMAKRIYETIRKVEV